MNVSNQVRHVTIPRVQRVRRRLSDGTYKTHFYHRPTGTVLPAPGSPEFQETYEAAERKFAQERARHSPAARAEVSNETPSLGIIPNEELPLFITPEELSLRWRGKVDVETLKNWRAQPLRIGPPFHRFGRAVLYRLDLLERWEQQNLISTGTEREDDEV
jgi:hypothetical protein